DVDEDAAWQIAEWQVQGLFHHPRRAECRYCFGRAFVEGTGEIALGEVRLRPGRLVAPRHRREEELASDDVVDEVRHIPRRARGGPVELAGLDAAEHLARARDCLLQRFDGHHAPPVDAVSLPIMDASEAGPGPTTMVMNVLFGLAS